MFFQFGVVLNTTVQNGKITRIIDQYSASEFLAALSKAKDQLLRVMGIESEHREIITQQWRT